MRPDKVPLLALKLISLLTTNPLSDCTITNFHLRDNFHIFDGMIYVEVHLNIRFVYFDSYCYFKSKSYVHKKQHMTETSRCVLKGQRDSLWLSFFGQIHFEIQCFGFYVIETESVSVRYEPYSVKRVLIHLRKLSATSAYPSRLTWPKLFAVFKFSACQRINSTSSFFQLFDKIYLKYGSIIICTC